MPSVLEPVDSELAELYSGWNRADVGLGLIRPNIYASDEYRQTKVQNILVGTVSLIVYAGFEHDSTPLVLTIGRISAYNVILGLNLHYVPPDIRRAIIKYHIESNVNNIENNLPMKVDYEGMSKAIPEAEAITRMYKQVGVNVIETYRIVDLPQIIQKPSAFQNHYRYYM